MNRGDVVLLVATVAGGVVLGIELAWHRANRRLGRDLERLDALGPDAVPAPRIPPDSTAPARR